MSHGSGYIGFLMVESTLMILLLGMIVFATVRLAWWFVVLFPLWIGMVMIIMSTP